MSPARAERIVVLTMRVLALSFAVAFVVTVPVNKWLIGRGKGHAVVHQYHHHDEHSEHAH